MSKWICTPIAVAALLMASAATPARAAGHVSAQQLLRACQADPEEEKSFCMAYVLGVADGHMSLQAAAPDMVKFFCLPAGVSAGRIVEVTVGYLTAHPADLHYAAADEVALALHDAFAC
ncbi:MAG: hypothetical protein K1X35_09775 [Caulobacteraceae bacterium]|nr:hypothetical protein [Caulobacteraceae bacterium]